MLSLPAQLLLIGLRVPIGIALGIVSLVGFAFLRNVNVVLGVIRTTPFEVAANWHLTAIPMFMLIGPSPTIRR